MHLNTISKMRLPTGPVLVMVRSAWSWDEMKRCILVAKTVHNHEVGDGVAL
jgi:hypothetical protein